MKVGPRGLASIKKGCKFKSFNRTHLQKVTMILPYASVQTKPRQQNCPTVVVFLNYFFSSTNCLGRNLLRVKVSVNGRIKQKTTMSSVSVTRRSVSDFEI